MEGRGGMGAGGRRDNGSLSFPKEGGFEWVQRDGVGGVYSPGWKVILSKAWLRNLG